MLVLSLNTFFNCHNIFNLISFHIISSYFIIGFICQVWGVSSHPSLLLEPLSLWSQLFETVAKSQMLPWIQGPSRFKVSNVSHFCILNNIIIFFYCTSSFVFSWYFFSWHSFIFHFHLERSDIPNSHRPVIPVRTQRSQRHVVWMLSWHRASNVKFCMSLTLVHARHHVVGLDAATGKFNRVTLRIRNAMIVRLWHIMDIMCRYRTVSLWSLLVGLILKSVLHWINICQDGLGHFPLVENFQDFGEQFFQSASRFAQDADLFPGNMVYHVELWFEEETIVKFHEQFKKKQVPQLQSALSFGKGCCVGNLLFFVGFSLNGRSQSPNGN